MKKNRIPSEADRRTIRAGRRYGALVLIVLACAAMTCPALAADDPLMLILVAHIKGAERIAKEMFGL